MRHSVSSSELVFLHNHSSAKQHNNIKAIRYHNSSAFSNIILFSWRSLFFLKDPPFQMLSLSTFCLFLYWVYFGRHLLTFICTLLQHPFFNIVWSIYFSVRKSWSLSKHKVIFPVVDGILNINIHLWKYMLTKGISLISRQSPPMWLWDTVFWAMCL